VGRKLGRAEKKGGGKTGRGEKEIGPSPRVGRERVKPFPFYFSIFCSILFKRMFKTIFEFKEAPLNKTYAAAWVHKHVSRPYSEF